MYLHPTSVRSSSFSIPLILYHRTMGLRGPLGNSTLKNSAMHTVSFCWSYHFSEPLTVFPVCSFSRAQFGTSDCMDTRSSAVKLAILESL